jgi:pyrimidine-nucleoside phosphorylase
MASTPVIFMLRSPQKTLAVRPGVDHLICMYAIDIIRRKRDGLRLTDAEIDAFVAGASSGSWPDYQVAALLMATFLLGMSEAETAALTRAMVASGTRLDLSDLPGPKVDKHSTGGVGDKTSLILAPVAAACGVFVPMMSGRGLGHSGGTLDKLEAIPGFRVHLSLAEFRAVLAKVGCAMIGQTAEIAPADKKLYALRDVTATVESIPLITASIMSKKIAEGIGGLVLDVKCGQGAFMKTPDAARALARALVDTGHANGVATRAVLTAMDVPLGNCVGNALEVRESIAVLRGEGPEDLAALSLALAADMIHLGGLAATLPDASAKVRHALASGQGLERFRKLVEEQGGDPYVVDDPRRLPVAPEQHIVRAERAGFVADIHAELVGRACVLLGAGRLRVEDRIDPGVGIVLLAHRGAEIRAGAGLLEVHHGPRSRLPEALGLLRQAVVLADAPAEAAPLVLGTES